MRMHKYSHEKAEVGITKEKEETQIADSGLRMVNLRTCTWFLDSAEKAESVPQFMEELLAVPGRCEQRPSNALAHVAVHRTS
jgi:hypothetical protein